MPTGWERLGAALAGNGVAADEAYRKRLSDNISMGSADQRLQQAIMETEGLTGLGDAFAGLGVDPAQAQAMATIGRAKVNPRNFTGAVGDLQEQERRQLIVEAARSGDWNLANAIAMGNARGPQALPAVQGDTLLANRFLEGGGATAPTQIGEARIDRLASQSQADEALVEQRLASALSSEAAARLRNVQSLRGGYNPNAGRKKGEKAVSPPGDGDWQRYVQAELPGSDAEAVGRAVAASEGIEYTPSLGASIADQMAKNQGQFKVDVASAKPTRSFTQGEAQKALDDARRAIKLGRISREDAAKRLIEAGLLNSAKVL